MALTYKLSRASTIPVNEGWHLFTGKVSFDDSYPSGGYTVPKQLRFETRFKTFMGVMFESAGNRTVEYVRTTGKLKVYISAGMEVTSGSDISYITNVPFLAWGYGVHN